MLSNEPQNVQFDQILQKVTQLFVHVFCPAKKVGGGVKPPDTHFTFNLQKLVNRSNQSTDCNVLPSTPKNNSSLVNTIPSNSSYEITMNVSTQQRIRMTTYEFIMNRYCRYEFLIEREILQISQTLSQLTDSGKKTRSNEQEPYQINRGRIREFSKHINIAIHSIQILLFTYYNDNKQQTLSKIYDQTMSWYEMSLPAQKYKKLKKKYKNQFRLLITFSVSTPDSTKRIRIILIQITRIKIHDTKFLSTVNQGCSNFLYFLFKIIQKSTDPIINPKKIDLILMPNLNYMKMEFNFKNLK
eukprot:TRINITY_DN3588_c1_g1_i5.p2 TRINITY_DN3588_c1_g1~~TRINITY_DN3588_c1_g1_i5.p2  ORF type:complete len:299 (-),score=-10.46 TRINITY_DN3588_c1_g1_i5:213-1109(-)